MRTGLEYVPPLRRRAYLQHLLTHVVADDGRLILGVSNEERGERGMADDLLAWGYAVAGTSERDHRHPDVVYRVCWLDL